MSDLDYKQTTPAPECHSSSEPNQDVSSAASTRSATYSASAAPPLKYPGSKYDPKLYTARCRPCAWDENAGSTRKMQTILPVRKPSKKQFVGSIRTLTSAPTTCRSSTWQLQSRLKALCLSGTTRTARTRGATRLGSAFARLRVHGSVCSLQRR